MILTLRQLEILALAGNGNKYKDIAARCMISPRTVEKLMDSARKRTHSGNNVQLLARSIVDGSLEIGFEGFVFVCDDAYETKHTSREENPRNSLRYKEWRLAVFYRDCFKCIDCGLEESDEISLHAHHLKPWADFIELRFELDNGVTVCATCHADRHQEKKLVVPISREI